jgi:glucose-1-phosphate adenylyltransferase
LMGADYYESPSERSRNLEIGKVPLGIGANTTIQRAIIDKNARIGRNVQIVNRACVAESNREAAGFVIQNRIVVVIKNATIPDGTVI